MNPVEWKQVPPELVNGSIIFASRFGDIRYNRQFITGQKNAKDIYGLFSTCSIAGHIYFYHDLVYYAHSPRNISDKIAGKVIIKYPLRSAPIGIHRNWYIDLALQL